MLPMSKSVNKASWSLSLSSTFNCSTAFSSFTTFSNDKEPCSTASSLGSTESRRSFKPNRVKVDRCHSLPDLQKNIIVTNQAARGGGDDVRPRLFLSFLEDIHLINAEIEPIAYAQVWHWAPGAHHPVRSYTSSLPLVLPAYRLGGIHVNIQVVRLPRAMLQSLMSVTHLHLPQDCNSEVKKHKPDNVIRTNVELHTVEGGGYRGGRHGGRWQVQQPCEARQRRTVNAGSRRRPHASTAAQNVLFSWGMHTVATKLSQSSNGRTKHECVCGRLAQRSHRVLWRRLAHLDGVHALAGSARHSLGERLGHVHRRQRQLGRHEPREQRASLTASAPPTASRHYQHTLAYLPLPKKPSDSISNGKTDRQGFHNFLDEYIQLNVPMKTPEDIDNTCLYLTNLIQVSAWKNSPVSTCLPKMSLHSAESLREKQRLRRIWHQSGHPADKTAFNRAAKQIKKLLQEQANSSFRNTLERLSPQGKGETSLWKAAKSFAKPQQHHAPLKQSNSWARTDAEKAEVFANYLEKVFKDGGDESEIDKVLRQDLQLCLPIRPTSPKEIARSPVTGAPSTSVCAGDSHSARTACSGGGSLISTASTRSRARRATRSASGSATCTGGSASSGGTSHASSARASPRAPPRLPPATTSTRSLTLSI
ncbi:unnamed protein product, partial [Leptidea sinapis]